MSNNYYVFTPRFIPGTKVRAQSVNNQFDLLEDAFDLLPTDPASIAQGKSTLGVESGSGDAYVVTMTPVRTANASGDEVVFKATHQNGGASTLQVDSIAAVSLVRWNGDALSAADILSGSYYVARYDSANTRFMIVAPAQSTIVGALTYAAPTASVGLAAVAGAATTVMRSDAAPALSQSIIPTWTGVHTFSATPVFSAGVSVTGNATASGLFLGGNGGASGPTFSFSSDPNTGAYSVGADDWGVATGGVLRFDISTTAVTSTLPYLNANGSNTAPAFSFSGDPNTGSYNVGADDWGVATGGTLRFDISTTAITSTLPFRGANGSNTAPQYSFSGDTNTGSYNVGADDWGVATNGTLRFDISTTAITATLPYLSAAGSATAPTYSFSGDSNTGVYSAAAGSIDFAIDGVRIFAFQSGAMFGPVGSASTPAYTFLSDSDTGFYQLGANQIGISIGGALSLAINSSKQFLAATGSASGPGVAFLADSGSGMYNAGGSNGCSLASGATMFLQGALGINTVTLGFNSSTTLWLQSLTSASASAGGGAALPASVAGFLAVTINGSTSLKIPYYAT